ncbi:MAG TPA: glycosyltransferase [Sphingomicrobium sp.]|nr:glycosyltransferase [Sphingomicrobium sp.]
MEVLVRLGDGNETEFEQTQLPEYHGPGWQNRPAGFRFNSADFQNRKVQRVGSMSDPLANSVPITIVIEWENAIDVDDQWTHRAMEALQRELAETAADMPTRPRIMYLYDKNAVEPGTIERTLDKVAPDIRSYADVEIVPTPGLTYYKLKNYGIARSRTELTVMLDSDAAPEPGWLESLLKPFADPEVMVVGGFTVLGADAFLSRTMALAWVFNLPHEREKTARRQKIHVNNCAVRTDFFQEHPFPDLPAFKKQCVFWLRGLTAQGFKFVRSPDAMAIHAPHPGLKFLAWRAWTGGIDADFLAAQTVTNSRFGRLGHAFRYFARKVWRSWRNIYRHGAKVGLPIWQRPFAMLVTLTFYLVTLAGNLWSAATRDIAPLPAIYRRGAEPC